MDISEYWKTIKKQATKLTGVEKISVGVFHRTGIGSSLEEYIAAVKSGNGKKIVKTAKKALKETKDYSVKVHAKELKTGKKAMTADQLRSAKIVGDALDLIIEQLEAVMSGDALAGSFDGDAVDDAAHSHEPLDPALDRAAKAHVTLRLKVAKDAKGYVAKYKSDASALGNYLKLAQKAAGDAKSTKQSGDTFNNMQAQDIAARAVDEIQAILDKISSHYDTNISGNGSDFMKARGDFVGKNDLPSWYRPDYMKGHNAAWGKVMDQVAEIDKVRATLGDAINQAQKFADVAESFSMQAIDPAKLIAKLEKIETDAKKYLGSVGLAHTRVLNVAEMATAILTSDLDGPGRLKALELREGDAKKRIEQCVNGSKQMQALAGRITAIVKGVEDATVREAAAAAAAPVRELTALMRNFKAEVGVALGAIRDVKGELSTAVG